MNAISQTFDFKRFCLNLKLDLCTEGRAWLGRLLMMTGFITIFLCLFVHDSPSSADDASAVFYVCALAFGALGGSMFMSNMSTNGLRLNTLMSPASQFEKFLTRWTICILGVTVCFFVSFAIADLIRVGFMSAFVWEPGDVSWVGPFNAMMAIEHWYYLWLPLISLQATYVLGSTVWPKDSFRKTFAAQIIIGIVCGVIFSIVMNWLIRNYIFIGFDHGFFENEVTVACWSVVAWTLFCYVVAWFRFRESEIIHRY